MKKPALLVLAILSAAALPGQDPEVEIAIDANGELEINVPADAVHPIDTIIVLELQ